jgi:hypothetical protein
MSQLADSLENWCSAAAKPTFQNYEVDSGRVLGVIFGKGVPREGFTTACSYGVAHEDWSGAEFSDRCELVTAWWGPIAGFDNLLVAVAREVIRNRAPPKPGMIFVDALKAAAVAGVMDRMPHALILPPYLWTQGFDVCNAGTQRVWFLQIVPIFERERNCIEERGFANFEDILRFDGVHFTDTNRASHIA